MANNIDSFTDLSFIAVDVEPDPLCGLVGRKNGAIPPAPAQMASYLQQFYSAVLGIKALGKIPVIYTSQDFWNFLTGCNNTGQLPPQQVNVVTDAMGDIIQIAPADICTQLVNTVPLWDTELFISHTGPTGNQDCGDGIVGLGGAPNGSFLSYELINGNTISATDGYPNGWPTRAGNQYDQGPKPATGGSCTGDAQTFPGYKVDWDFFDPSLFPAQNQ
jgi:hypothetical protein